jgi:hypothetical protein
LCNESAIPKDVDDNLIAASEWLPKEKDKKVASKGLDLSVQTKTAI